MRILFIVQGEGRGHLTQALALRAMLARAGHEVCHVLAGSVRHRELPDFFVNKIGAPVELFGSPGFDVGDDHRSIRPFRTVMTNIVRTPEFKRALQTIETTIEATSPDLVLTFYEPMAGVFQALKGSEVPFVAVGHQYMFDHPAYTFASGRMLDRSGIQFFTRMTAYGASWKLGLSLYPATDLPDEQLSVVPPFLRDEVLVYADELPPDEGFLLVYLLNHGYAEQVVSWHRDHPEVRLECFWDRPDAAAIVEYDDTLRFHRLHDTVFLDLMSRCSGLVCTAGFESVSEALFLGKPVMAVPVEGHFEQRCNAREVEMLGAGIHADRFDVSRLLNFVDAYSGPTEAFRKWVSLAEDRAIHALEAVAAGQRPPLHAEAASDAASTSALPVTA